MLLPYNVTVYSMITYLIGTLEIVKTEELDNPISSNTEPETKFLNIENIDGKNYKRWFGIFKDSTNVVEYVDLYLYCKTLVWVIEQECPNIKSLMTYLDHMSKLMTDLGLLIVWRLPSGLTVRQQYMSIKQKKLHLIHLKNQL